jgi:PTS system galactitol-specific IIB component
VASSQTAKYAIDEYLKKNGIKDVEVFCCKFSELDHHAQYADLIVAASKLYKEYPIPIVNGLCYLTGMGIDEVNKKILDYVKE